MAKKRFIYNDFLWAIESIKEGFEINDEVLYDISENVNEPLNEEYPESYTEISEADYQLIKKEAISRGVNDDFYD